MTSPILLDGGPSTRGWHQIEAALRCPQLWAYQYKDRVIGPDGKPERPTAPADALIRGTLVHVGAAHLFGTKAIQEGGLTWQGRRLTSVNEIYHPHDALRAMALDQGQWAEEWVKHLPTATAMIDALYHEAIPLYYRAHVVAIEQEMRSTIGGELYTQRADLIVEDADGGVWIDDVKTSARAGAGAALKFALSGQMLGYRWFGDNLWGSRFRGVRVILVQSTPPHKVERVTVPAAPFAAMHFERSVEWANETIRRCAAMGLKANAYPKVLSEQGCITPYGRCSYFDACRFGG